MKKFLATIVITCACLLAQKTDDGTVGFGTQDNHQAKTSPFQTGTSDPATCSATTREFFYRTDTHVLKECTATNTWTAVPVGFTNHALLSNLTFAASGHTGFASSSHAATHLAAGSDPLTSTSAVANGVPQANSSGIISRNWLETFGGATGSAGGTKGAVPAPGATDNVRCLHGDGSWGDCGSSDLLNYLTQKGTLLTTPDGTSLIGQAPGQIGQVVAYDDSTPTGLRPATLIFNNDADLVLASNQSGTCKASDQISFVSANAPTCSIGSGSSDPHSYAGLDFPDGVLTCIELYPIVPNSWSGGQVDMRVKWTNQSGHWGVNSGGVCIADTGHSNEQQCLKLSVQTGFYPDGTAASTAPSNAAKLSDVMPARGANNEFTGAIRGLDMTGAAQRYGSRMLLCRDARSSNSACTGSTPATTACDGIVGTIRIMKVVLNWPTVIQVQ